jgi:hypothetical protein
MRRNSAANVKLTKERIKSVAARRMQAELLLAKARNDLIATDLVTRQAAYLLVALRQKILNAPTTYCRRMVAWKTHPKPKECCMKLRFRSSMS